MQAYCAKCYTPLNLSVLRRLTQQQIDDLVQKDGKVGDVQYACACGHTKFVEAIPEDAQRFAQQSPIAGALFMQARSDWILTHHDRRFLRSLRISQD